MSDILEININEILYDLIDSIQTFWDDIPIFQIWSWLPSDIRFVLNMLLSIFTVMAMIGLFIRIAHIIGNLIGGFIGL